MIMKESDESDNVPDDSIITVEGGVVYLNENDNS